MKARYCAVDGLGNLFFTEDEKGQIHRVPSTVLNQNEGVDPNSEEKKSAVAVYSEVLYEHATGEKPHGIAADNFHIYWGNSKGHLFRAADGSTGGEVKKGVASTHGEISVPSVKGKGNKDSVKKLSDIGKDFGHGAGIAYPEIFSHYLYFLHVFFTKFTYE